MDVSTLKDDEPVSLGDVPAILDHHFNIQVSRQTVYKWASHGLKLHTGSYRTLQVEPTDDGKVKLKHQTRLGRYYTTLRWIRDFVENT